MFDTCPALEELERFVARQRSDQKFDDIAAHVEACSPCQERLSRCAKATQLIAPASRPSHLSGQAREILAKVCRCGLAVPSDSRSRNELPEVPGFCAEEILGKGGQAQVVRARESSVGNRLVALKLIGIRGQSLLEDEVVRFQIEAEAFARLEHPNIVRIYQVGLHDARPYLVLEYVAGGTLADYLQQNGPLRPRAAAKLLELVARAVDFAHAQGIVHRDLKPRNVLMTPEGAPKLGDFGLARLIDSDQRLTSFGQVMGTLQYLSPEQAAGMARTAGPGADIYALGVILFEMLTGSTPHGCEDQHANVTLRRICEEDAAFPVRCNVPRDLMTICLKCLAKQPERRYRSAGELANDLHRYMHDLPITARPARWYEKFFRRLRR